MHDLEYSACVQFITPTTYTAITFLTLAIPVVESNTSHKVLGVNAELPKVLSFKPEPGQNIAMHALPAARNSVYLISTFALSQLCFFPDLFQHKVTC